MLINCCLNLIVLYDYLTVNIIFELKISSIKLIPPLTTFRFKRQSTDNNEFKIKTR
jgi:hypothetical protein